MYSLASVDNIMAGRVLRVQLSNGYKIPAIGLGTWKSKPGEVQQAVKDAIDAGYRHFDCAFAYQNEAEVGDAIQEKISDGSVKRDDLFITSKCWNTFHSKDKVFECLNKSLSSLKLDYLDLYLIHWPLGYKEGGELFPKDETGKFLYSDVDYLETWKAMEECHKKGLVRSIGLSNFNSVQIKRICSNATIKPVMLQVECHPYLTQCPLLEFCKSLDIKVTAYSPLGSPDRPWAKPDDPQLLEEPKIKEIAKKYNKSSAQVLLRFQVQRGVIVIPKSVTKERIISNIQLFDFELTPEEMETIGGFNRDYRVCHLAWSKDHPHYPFSIPF
ncbi:aldose reductase-like isoform X1 [Centruroides sculpturatus]|uniref:aldose reductase-like isoform X1 n=1 Tax=Centruroides sculpturatus TaxID=218467 RepID=UPI000C6EAA3A|nr:aldose reductase-like isoform X1 [Centruroides sculpturatus]